MRGIDLQEKGFTGLGVYVPGSSSSFDPRFEYLLYASLQAPGKQRCDVFFSFFRSRSFGRDRFELGEPPVFWFGLDELGYYSRTKQSSLINELFKSK